MVKVWLTGYVESSVRVQSSVVCWARTWSWCLRQHHQWHPPLFPSCRSCNDSVVLILTERSRDALNPGMAKAAKVKNNNASTQLCVSSVLNTKVLTVMRQSTDQTPFINGETTPLRWYTNPALFQNERWLSQGKKPGEEWWRIHSFRITVANFEGN